MSLLLSAGFRQPLKRSQDAEKYNSDDNRIYHFRQDTVNEKKTKMQPAAH